MANEWENLTPPRNDSDHARLLAVADKWQALYEQKCEEVERLRKAAAEHAMNENYTLEGQRVLQEMAAENERLRDALTDALQLARSLGPWTDEALAELETIEATAAASGTGPTRRKAAAEEGLAGGSHP